MKNGAGFFLGSLAIAFIVFITIRGELSRYMDVVFGINSTKFGGIAKNGLTGIGF